MRLFRLGEWTVEPDRNVVSRDGLSEQIEPRTMDVLLCLVAHKGETVSLQSILDEVWVDRVVEENSVHRRIYQIRKVLGDSADEPTYIESVPRKGYRLIARVSEPEQASVVRADDIEPMALDRPANVFVRINQFFLIGENTSAYFWFAAFGAVPILLAYLFGAWEDRLVAVASLESCPLGSHQNKTQGFSQRLNWLVYPAVLPVWLFLSRRMFRLSYGLSDNSPLLTERKYLPIRNNLVQALSSPRPFLIILAVNVLLTGIDQSDVIMRFVDINQVCPTGVMDWGWYGFVFNDVSVWSIGVLTIWTTAEQMLFVQMALGTAVYVWLFNLAYMRSIYLRSRGETGACYVLDFDDPDGRFGLRKISKIFDLQLFFCVFGGAVLLVERYMNTNLAVTETIGMQMWCVFNFFGTGCNEVPAYEWASLSWLMQDTAQVFVVLSWLLYLTSILWIANVKLLPLRTAGERAGRVSYLRELVPPGTKYDRHLEGNPNEVDHVAERFRSHHFWPTGDDRARDTLMVALFIGFLLLLPIWPSNGPLTILIGTFATLGLLLAHGFLWIQRHILRRVDLTLVN